MFYFSAFFDDLDFSCFSNRHHYWFCLWQCKKINLRQLKYTCAVEVLNRYLIKHFYGVEYMPLHCPYSWTVGKRSPFKVTNWGHNFRNQSKSEVWGHHLLKCLRSHDGGARPDLAGNEPNHDWPRGGCQVPPWAVAARGTADERAHHAEEDGGEVSRYPNFSGFWTPLHFSTFHATVL